MKNLHQREEAEPRIDALGSRPAAVDIKDAAQLNILRERVAELGWTFKARFIDHDITKPLIGVRLTNAAAMFEAARSIQIFDKSTVTLQTGFTNDEAISLTKDDGRDFLLWLRTAKPDLVAAIWDALPDAGSPEAEATAGPFVDLDKNQLVMYLAHAYPELFGPNGIVALTGANFHAELLRVIKDPQRDDLKRFDLVQALENLAHQFYREAAAYLRSAAHDDVYGHKEHAGPRRQTALALILAAERSRDEANVIRQRMENPPPVQPFPEAISANDQGEAASPEAGEPVTIMNVVPGDVVGVTDPQSAYFRQIGRVVQILPKTQRVTLEISGQSHPLQFAFDQLMKLA